MKNKYEKKSPIKTPPLKRAGESMWRKVVAKNTTRVIFTVMFLSFLLGYIVRNGLDGLGFPTAWHNWVYVAAVPLMVYIVFFIRKAERQEAKVFLGRQGERIVAEELAKLGRRDNQGRLLWREFHDVELPEGGNADHLLVCEMGVYCLETKTLRKSGELDALVFDGDKVGFRNGGVLTKPDPIRQARGCARQVSEFLTANNIFAGTGERKIFVKPVVVFPGWAVEWTPEGEPEKAKILVCGEKGLGRIEEKRQEMPADYLLSPEKITAIAAVLDAGNRPE